MNGGWGKFCVNSLLVTPLVSGSGAQFRDFVHVQDVGRSCILGYQGDIRGASINVGSGVIRVSSATHVDFPLK